MGKRGARSGVLLAQHVTRNQRHPKGRGRQTDARARRECVAGVAHRGAGAHEENAEAVGHAVWQTGQAPQDDAGGDDLHGASVDCGDEALAPRTCINYFNLKARDLFAVGKEWAKVEYVSAPGGYVSGAGRPAFVGFNWQA